MSEKPLVLDEKTGSYDLSQVQVEVLYDIMESCGEVSEELRRLREKQRQQRNQ